MKITIENGVTIINTGDPVGGRKAVSGHTGVVWMKDRQTYRAEIYIQGKRLQLGQSPIMEEMIALRKLADHHREAGTFNEWFEALPPTVRRKRTKKS